MTLHRLSCGTPPADVRHYLKSVADAVCVSTKLPLVAPAWAFVFTVTHSRCVAPDERPWPQWIVNTLGTDLLCEWGAPAMIFVCLLAGLLSAVECNVGHVRGLIFLALTYSNMFVTPGLLALWHDEAALAVDLKPSHKCCGSFSFTAFEGAAPAVIAVCCWRTHARLALGCVAVAGLACAALMWREGPAWHAAMMAWGALLGAGFSRTRD